MPSQLHIRTPDWTKDGRNYTDVKARCGQDVHTDAPSGRANRINAVLIDTPIQYQRAYERLLYAIANIKCVAKQPSCRARVFLFSSGAVIPAKAGLQKRPLTSPGQGRRQSHGYLLVCCEGSVTISWV